MRPIHPPLREGRFRLAGRRHDVSEQRAYSRASGRGKGRGGGGRDLVRAAAHEAWLAPRLHEHLEALLFALVGHDREDAHTVDVLGVVAVHEPAGGGERRPDVFREREKEKERKREREEER